MSVSGNAFTGTLANITDGSIWDAGTWGSDENTGHFIFVKATNIPEGATVVFEKTNGTSGPVTLDSDLNVIARITDKVNQKLKLTVTTETATITKIYSLAGMTLA